MMHVDQGLWPLVWALLALFMRPNLCIGEGEKSDGLFLTLGPTVMVTKQGAAQGRPLSLAIGALRRGAFGGGFFCVPGPNARFAVTA